MPQIPTFENTLPVPAAHIDPAEAGRVAESIARGGAEIAGVAGTWAQRYAESRRAVMASDAMVSAQSGLQQSAQQWARKAGTTDENGEIIGTDQVANGFVDQAKQLRAQTLGRISDPFIQAMVAEHFDHAMIAHAETVRGQGFVLERDARVGKLDQQLYGLASDAAIAQTPEAKAQVVTTATTAINTLRDAGFLPGSMAAQKTILFNENMQRIAAEQERNAALASHDPAIALAWAKKINDPASYPGMNPQVRETLGYRADLMADRIAAKRDVQLRASVHARWSDNVASIAATGAPATSLSEAEIRAAFPEDADHRIEALALARDTWHATGAVALTSPKEDDAMVAKFAPAGLGFAEKQRAQNAVIAAINAKYGALYGAKADPAAYVLGTDPDTARLFQQAQQDPAQLDQAVASLDAAYDRLGLPADQRHVLPKDAAQSIAKAIEQDPANAPAKMKQLESQWGAAWPRAWRDMVALGKLSPSYQAVPTLADERDGALLARWLAEVPKGKTGADLIGVKAENDIKTTIRTDTTAVQPFLSSLSRSGAGLGQVDGVLQAIDDLAFAKYYYDRDPRAAVNAIDSFTGRFEFMPDGGARVPRERFDAVSANASRTLQGLDLAHLAVPPLYGQPGMPSSDDYLRMLRAAPSWITAPEADALWLMDTGGRIVRGRDGRPVAVPFTAPMPEGALGEPSPVVGTP